MKVFTHKSGTLTVLEFMSQLKAGDITIPDATVVPAFVIEDTLTHIAEFMDYDMEGDTIYSLNILGKRSGASYLEILVEFEHPDFRGHDGGFNDQARTRWWVGDPTYEYEDDYSEDDYDEDE